MSDLQKQAEELLGAVDAAEDEKKHERLTPEDRAMIFQLAARDIPQAEIARIVGKHPSTVCRTLKFIDMRQGARAILNSKAAKMAEHVIEKGDPETHRKVLTQMDVLPKEGGGAPMFFVAIGVTESEEQRRANLVDVNAQIRRAAVDGVVVKSDAPQ